MKLKLLVGMTGGITLQPGDEYDFEQAEAFRLMEAGFAVPVAERRVETATVRKPQERRKK